MEDTAPDTFVLGANLPWVRYGTDFGSNAWHPDGGIGAHPDPARLLALLRALRAHGVRVVRWFALCDGRAGVRFDDDGTPRGLDPLVWRDLDAALGLIDAAGLQLLPVLLDYLWCAPARRVNGVTLGGRRSSISHPRQRAALLDAVIDPLVSRYGGEPVIAGWDLLNEPEWVTFGAGTWRPLDSVSQGTMRRFLRDAAARVHAGAVQPVTVGSASARWLGLVRGLGLDFYQVHWYEPLERRAPLARPVRALGCDRPVLLGEFPT
ncbi:MAG TPA: hypothetical protein VF136_12305, partial [Methylomirabilota bacterium]